MPNAPTHDAITLITAVGADIAYYHFAPHPDFNLAALFTASYIFAGYACAGDLDLDSKEYRRWGPFRFIWWPYRQCVPHRSWMSHGLVMGGVIRVGYLATVCTLLFWLCLWLVSRAGPHVDPNQVTQAGWLSIFAFAHVHPDWTAAMLGGFILAGSAHSTADGISTWFKRRF
jgi:uncharacterized metal-binding protein